MQEDEALDLGKALSKNHTLERLLADRTPLAVQQLLCGERLNLNGLEFSEVDASLMAQLLVHNTTLTCADLGGAKQLTNPNRTLTLTLTLTLGRDTAAWPGAARASAPCRRAADGPRRRA